MYVYTTPNPVHDSESNFGRAPFPQLSETSFRKGPYSPQLTQLGETSNFGWVLTPQLIIWKMDPALLPEYLLNKKWTHPTSQTMG
jgi:hypothetical protein